MNSEKKHKDDFKQLFESHQMPEIPLDMEEKVMFGIELKQRKKQSAAKWFSTNFVVFSVGIVLLVILSVVQFIAQIRFADFHDIKILLLSSTGIFFILWVIETADMLLQNKFSKEISNF